MAGWWAALGRWEHHDAQNDREHTRGPEGSWPPCFSPSCLSRDLGTIPSPQLLPPNSFRSSSRLCPAQARFPSSLQTRRVSACWICAGQAKELLLFLHFQLHNYIARSALKSHSELRARTKPRRSHAIRQNICCATAEMLVTVCNKGQHARAERTYERLQT